jgi:hypothetical protein
MTNDKFFLPKKDNDEVHMVGLDHLIWLDG